MKDEDTMIECNCGKKIYLGFVKDKWVKEGAKAERERIEKIIRHYAKLYDGKGYPLLPKWEGILEELKQKKEFEQKEKEVKK